LPDIEKPGSRPAEGQGEIYIEFVPSGAYVKVSAIDPVTGLEGTIVGPANLPRRALENQAMRKLQWVLDKAREKSAPATDRGGRLV